MKAPNQNGYSRPKGTGELTGPGGPYGAHLGGGEREELVDIIYRLEARLSRVETHLGDMDTTLILRDLDGDVSGVSFPENVEVPVFQQLPATLAGAEVGSTGDTAWRVALVSTFAFQAPIGLDLLGDVMIGRKSLGSHFGLDLTDYGGDLMGVSRRHALLRPTPYSLFLFDMSSRNGTFVNGQRLEPGNAHRLAEGDVLSFGRLHLRVHLVSIPDTYLGGPDARH